MKGSFIWYGVILVFLIVIYGLLDPTFYPFPKCPFKTYTGLLCPGCGSQRAIHHALHGRFAASMQLNPLFLPAVVYALMALFVSVLTPRKWLAVRSKYYGIRAAWIALIIILVFWIMRNIF